MGVIPKYRKARIGLSNKELVFLVFGHTRHYQWYEKAASKSRLGLKELLEVKTSEQKALQNRIVDLFRDKAWKKQGLNQGLLTELISKAYVISFSGTETRHSLRTMKLF